MKAMLITSLTLAVSGFSYAEEVVQGKISNLVSKGNDTYVQLTEDRIYIDQTTPDNVKDILLDAALIGKGVAIFTEDTVNTDTGVSRKVAVGVITR